MKTRREMLVLLGAGILALPFDSIADTTRRIRRIGFLAIRHRPDSLGEDLFYGQFLRELRELGYTEGGDLVVDWQFADGKYDSLPELAAELVKLRPEVLVTEGTAGILAAQKATKTIPTVFANAADPVGSRLVESLARPGGNLTGIALLVGDTGSKQLEMLTRMVPGALRVAVLFVATNPFRIASRPEFVSAARRLNVEILPIPVDVRTVQEITNAFVTMASEHVGAFQVTPDVALLEKRQLLAQLAIKYRLPGIATSRQQAEAGLLMSYGQDTANNYRRAAVYVDKILKGEKPAELPVEQPTNFELVINKQTAKALGLTIPPELLVQADLVIK